MVAMLPTQRGPCMKKRGGRADGEDMARTLTCSRLMSKRRMRRGDVAIVGG
jgi:hypothetical protein